jgi:uncharacterized membrane protein YgdD (TMEM256/DUF423 family)
MRPEARHLAATAAVLLGLGVAASAIGSHALAGRVDADGLRRFQIATQMLMWQGLGLLALMRGAAESPPPALVWTGVALLAGTLMFCGSVYALAFGAPRAVAGIAPLGGLLMIGGWLVAGGLLWRRPR